MRILSLLSLVLVLLIVAVLAKKQLDVTHAVKPAVPVSGGELHVPAVNNAQQAKQVVQQIQQDTNSLMQDRARQLEQDLENKQP